MPLASLLLLMSSLGVSDVRRFPFVDTPPQDAVENALLELKQHVSVGIMSATGFRPNPSHEATGYNLLGSLFSMRSVKQRLPLVICNL